MSLDRRALLIAVAAGGAALATGSGLGTTPAAAMPTGTPAAPAPRPASWPRRSSRGGPDPALLPLFASPIFNGEALFALGSASSRTGEVGEVLRIADEVNAVTGDPSSPDQAAFDAYVDAFGAAGDRLERLARQAGVKHPVTARQRHLRAAMYAAQQLFFVLGTSQPDREEDLFETSQQRWLAAVRRMDPPVEQFSVESAFGRLPAYFFRSPRGRGPRPTVVISDGSDGQNVETMQFGVTAALDRGYHAVLFEGPGQMSLLFKRQVPFTPDWQKVIGPIVKRVRARSDVGKVALVGISFAGMLCARAAARLSTLDAVVLEPAAWDMAGLWVDQESMDVVRQTHALPAPDRNRARAELNAGFLSAWTGGGLPFSSQFEIYKRGEIFRPQVLREARAGQPVSDYYALLEAMLPFRYDTDLKRITIPTLVTSNEADENFGAQSRQAYEFLDRVPRARKEYVRLTAAEGASLHDQPVGPQVAEEYVFDWLDDQLR